MSVEPANGPAHAAVVIDGVRLASAAAGIRHANRDDVLLIELAPGATSAAVFTRNKFCAAPVIVARKHIAAKQPRFLVFNAGNANAGTGAAGIEDTLTVTRGIAGITGCASEEVLPFSTGVIGQRLPAAKITAVLPQLAENLAADGWAAGARAIMTTDTVAKYRSACVETGGRKINIAGITKGSGMIHPDMATMLAFVATDAVIAQEHVQSALRECTETSFNRITVDGDTSTNDACVLTATGAAGGEPLHPGHSDWDAFVAGLQRVCDELAQAIVRDGEGATKFVEIVVSSASAEDSLAIAQTVAQSPLVKTALFASDPNWGRILAAVGRAPVADLRVEDVSIRIGDCLIVERGEPNPAYEEADAARIMAQAELCLRIDVGNGDALARVWTCDFSYDYVRINAEYRS